MQLGAKDSVLSHLPSREATHSEHTPNDSVMSGVSSSSENFTWGLEDLSALFITLTDPTKVHVWGTIGYVCQDP